MRCRTDGQISRNCAHNTKSCVTHPTDRQLHKPDPLRHHRQGQIRNQRHVTRSEAQKTDLRAKGACTRLQRYTAGLTVNFHDCVGSQVHSSHRLPSAIDCQKSPGACHVGQRQPCSPCQVDPARALRLRWHL
jgi:hypothetical protein